MGIRTKIAQTNVELDACYKLRHKVFADIEGSYEKQADGRIIDRFDAFTNSVTFLAADEDSVVGTIRLTLQDNCVGIPADDFFDFIPYLKGEVGTLANVGQLVVDPESRGQLRITNGLFMLMYYWANDKNVTHVVAPFNPALTKSMQRIGFTKAGEVVKSHHHNLDIQPMVLNLHEIRESFINFVAQQDIFNFMEPYCREYYRAGEAIITKGEMGEDAYFIVDGTVSVLLGNGTQVVDLSRGEVFGELALLVDVPRTANIVAQSDVALIVLSRGQFLSCIKNNPENAHFILQTLGKRLAKAIGSDELK
jgi:N-acyl-L-homoserine lactone synthetase